MSLDDRRGSGALIGRREAEDPQLVGSRQGYVLFEAFGGRVRFGGRLGGLSVTCISKSEHV